MQAWHSLSPYEPDLSGGDAHPLAAEWPRLRRLVNRALATSLHVAMATVDQDGAARVTPIGSFMLAPEVGRALYFERFVRGLPRNLERNARVSILAVDSGPFFWLSSLLKGRFTRPPGLRLVGRAGASREATPAERRRWNRRVRWLRRLPGHPILWRDLHMVREIEIIAVEPIRLGAMTETTRR